MIPPRKNRALKALLTIVALLLAAAGVPAQETPPAKGKLAEIMIVGTKTYPPEQVLEATGLKRGELVGREEIQAAADRLARLGPFLEVHYEFDSQGDELFLKFRVTEAPTVPVSFDNFPWFTDGELTQALVKAVALFDGQAPEQGVILDKMVLALEEILATRDVKGTVERELVGRPGSDGLMMQFKLKGPSLRVKAISFQDPLAAENVRIQEFSQELVGKPYSRFALALFIAEQVRPEYLKKGHLDVKVATPKARFTGDPNAPLEDQVLVLVPIEPGPVYRWGGVDWQGNQALERGRLDEFLGFTDGELADGMKLYSAWERVKNEYGRRGYLDVKLETEPQFDAAAGRVRYTAKITEGVQYHMGKIVLDGLALEPERKLLAAWKLKPGDVFDRMYFEEFMESGLKEAFEGMVVNYKEIQRWLEKHAEQGVVDVLLNFD